MLKNIYDVWQREKNSSRIQPCFSLTLNIVWLTRDLYDSGLANQWLLFYLLNSLTKLYSFLLASTVLTVLKLASVVDTVGGWKGSINYC